MKRTREDNDLEAALLESVADENDEDGQLQRAIEASMRQSQLEQLYMEMRANATQTCQKSKARENHAYNLNHNALLSTELILLRLLKHITMSTMSRLYRVSRTMGVLMDRLILQHPITSLRVESSRSFLAAQQPPSYKGPLFTQIAKTVHTLRFKIRRPDLPQIIYKANGFGYNIRRVIVNVLCDAEIYWFKRSFNLAGIDFVIYHEKRAYDDYKVRLKYYSNSHDCDSTGEEVHAIVDPRGRFFDALPNFDGVIEL